MIFLAEDLGDTLAKKSGAETELGQGLGTAADIELEEAQNLPVGACTRRRMDLPHKRSNVEVHLRNDGIRSSSLVKGFLCSLAKWHWERGLVEGRKGRYQRDGVHLGNDEVRNVEQRGHSLER